MQHEKQNRTWESLVLTGIDGWQVVFGKWLALIQYSLGTCLWLTISKLAIGYSVMQYLNVYPDWIDEGINNWNRAFVYMSYVGYGYSAPIAFSPQLWQIAITFVVLAALSLAEVGLLAALGILCDFIKSNFSVVKMGLASLLSISLSLIGIILVFTAGFLEWEAYSAHGFTPEMRLAYTNCEFTFVHVPVPQDRYQWCVVEQTNRRIFETVQVSAVTLADNGVLLAANIMRPIGTLQFAFRNLFSAIITLGVMVLITFFSLRIASRFVQKSAQ